MIPSCTSVRAVQSIPYVKPMQSVSSFRNHILQATLTSEGSGLPHIRTPELAKNLIIVSEKVRQETPPEDSYREVFAYWPWKERGVNARPRHVWYRGRFTTPKMDPETHECRLGHKSHLGGEERWPGVDRKKVYIGNPNQEAQPFERSRPEWPEGSVIHDEWKFVQAKMNNRSRWFGEGSMDVGDPQSDAKWLDGWVEEGQRRRLEAHILAARQRASLIQQ